MEASQKRPPSTLARTCRNLSRDPRRGRPSARRAAAHRRFIVRGSAFSPFTDKTCGAPDCRHRGTPDAGRRLDNAPNAPEEPSQCFHLIEQPIDGNCSFGPRPVSAICFMASYRSRRAFAMGVIREASSRPRYCSSSCALKPKKSGVH
jgi:hypothetical protein